MRRKPGALLSIELDILVAGLSLFRTGDEEFHGYALAKEIRERDRARTLTAHGTLYRALERLQTRGLVTSRWEDPEAAAAEQRPRRRLYRLTAEGERVAEPELERGRAPQAARRPGLAPS